MIDWGIFGLTTFSILLGFFLGMLTNLIKEFRDERKKQVNIKKLLKVILKEIDIGIDRANWHIKSVDSGIALGGKPVNPKSPTKIYTKLWDNTINIIAAEIKNIKIIEYIIEIYTRFELINVAVERNDLNIAWTFAVNYIGGMREYRSKLKLAIDRY